MRILRSLVHFTCLTINIYIYSVYAPLAKTFLNIKESGSAVNGEKKNTRGQKARDINIC